MTAVVPPTCTPIHSHSMHSTSGTSAAAAAAGAIGSAAAVAGAIGSGAGDSGGASVDVARKRATLEVVAFFGSKYF